MRTIAPSSPTGRPRRLEKACVLVIAASFLLPLAAGVCLRIIKPRYLGAAWLRNATLSGVRTRPAAVPLNAATVRSGQFQLALARAYDTEFAGRELLIRLNNELYFRFLRTAPNPIVVGPGRSLVEEAYPNEYCLERAPEGALGPLADDLRRLQDLCRARGTAFTVVVTPSKASVMPEALPSAWRRRFRPGKRYYDEFRRRLRERGIHHVDGHAITASLKSIAPAPVFPVGGVHWGDLAALATANALLENLAAQGLRAGPIRDYETRITLDARWQDKDMADLINTATPLRYPVAQVSIKESPPRASGSPPRAHRPTLVTVGGSFDEKLVAMLGASRQFSEVDFYFYYKVRKKCQSDGDIHPISGPVPPLDFETDVFAADALVLEVNEQILKSPNHLLAFLGDALAAVPDPHTARAPFHYESRLDYRWGDILSFDRNRCPARILSASGLAPAGDGGAYTDKRITSMVLATSPAATDMLLEASGNPFLVSGRLTRQRARVKVNGQSVGEMVWDQPEAGTRSLPIPRACLQEDETALEFEWPDAAAPAALGTGEDVRNLGICLAALCLKPAGQGPAGPDASGPARALAYRWGETLALTGGNPPPADTRQGFTTPGDAGSHTEGPLSILRLATGPAPRDVALKVKATPWLSPPRLATQNVDVYVNRHPVGRWTWTNQDTGERVLTIPRSFLDGDEARVEFRVSRPVSPAELAVSADTRKLGVCVASVCLQLK